MQIKRLCVVMLLLVLFFKFSFLWGEELQKIILKEVLSLGDLDDDKIFQWVGVTVDSDQNIYITDAMDYSIKLFDAQGNLMKRTVRRGEGPGEFLTPGYLDCSEQYIYISDQFKPIIHVFDKNLCFKHSIFTSRPIVDLKIISDNDIAISTLTTTKTGRIFVFDSKGKVKQEFKYFEGKIPFMMDMVNFEFDSQGNYYVAYHYKDKIEKFNLNGKKLWSRKLLKIKESKRKKVGSFKLPDKFVYKDIELDSSGYLFILGGSYSKNKSSDVYVLSPEGILLTIFALPDASHCIYIDDNDFLYSRANEGVTLKKYMLIKNS